MEESSYSEHLLVWSWRRLINGRPDCPVVAHEFAEACGQNEEKALLALCFFLKVLAGASRRRLAFFAGDPFSVTSDERQVLTLLAAAQAEDGVLFDAHLRWLAGPSQRPALQAATKTLVTILRECNLLLARPVSATSIQGEGPRLVTTAAVSVPHKRKQPFP